jgi:hypothetical protein
MFKPLLSFAFFVHIILPLSAQDLTGTWVGGSKNTDVRITLIKCGDHYVGYTFDWDHTGYGFCKTNFIANFDSVSKKLNGRSMGFIDKAGPHSQTNYNLRYSKNGDIEQLTGSASPKSFGTKLLTLGIPISGITLIKESEKVNVTQFMRAALIEHVNSMNTLALRAGENKTQETESISSEPLVNKDSLALLDALKTRSNPVVETIPISVANLQIKVYDNGVEDGDSISIVYNNRVLKSEMRVTVKPVSFDLALDESLSYHDITLIAHNLGTIPPNTATVEVRAGEQLYIIRASANMVENAVIRLMYTR